MVPISTTQLSEGSKRGDKKKKKKKAAVVLVDPPMRANRKCAVCPTVLPQIAVTNQDPFCSTQCCRSWYGIPLTRSGTGT